MLSSILGTSLFILHCLQKSGHHRWHAVQFPTPVHQGRQSRQTFSRPVAPVSKPPLQSTPALAYRAEATAEQSWRGSLIKSYLFASAAKSHPRGTKKSLHGRELQETAGAGLMGHVGNRTFDVTASRWLANAHLAARRVTWPTNLVTSCRACLWWHTECNYCWALAPSPQASVWGQFSRTNWDSRSEPVIL